MSAASGVRQHTARDLQAYGRRYGIDYWVPDLGARDEDPVVRGKVHELSLGQGMELVASDVEVLHRYDSRSRAASPLSIVVMLEGRADVSLEDRTLTLTPGMALSLRLDGHHGLQATQPAGQRLRALTLGLGEDRLAELGTTLPSASGSRMHAWRPPSALLQGLEQALATPLPAPAQTLLLEGLGLQLLAHGLPQATHDAASSDATPPTRLPPRERQRLERVRAALEDDPAAEHRLESLAKLAAMSPASLRRKFRAAFGTSVFDYLRDCRLRLAHDYLSRGSSVQQAAHFCGYRHASNFATAFRRRYGISPSSLTMAS
ncbi:helix-turn-helix transcriptional regulator [Halomonas getboli]|uniref:helix-turn-helix transcriptional regulator n=1 Tax=Halomonas getboli TaxID=2935862 RepID=UPI001FFE3A25|nr:helix-turn-helix transcriptional regulator [Halomonas getboli]MCK2184301.1 helix-turn-helix domain-containing protein [Halomonas getboli]